VYVPTRRRVWKLISAQAASRRGRASVADVCAAAATSVDVSGAWVTAGDGSIQARGQDHWSFRAAAGIRLRPGQAAQRHRARHRDPPPAARPGPPGRWS